MSRCHIVKFAVTGGEKKLILFPWPFRGIALWIFWSSITSKKIETPVPIKVLYDKVPYPHCFRGRARNYLRGGIIESSVSIIEQDDDGTRQTARPTQLIRCEQLVDGVIIAVAIDNRQSLYSSARQAALHCLPYLQGRGDEAQNRTPGR